MRPQSCPQEASEQPPRGSREANRDYTYFFVGRLPRRLIKPPTGSSFIAPATLTNQVHLHFKVGVRGNIRFSFPPLQDGPKGLQDCPKKAQEAPKKAPRRPKRPSRSRFGTLLGANLGPKMSP